VVRLGRGAKPGATSPKVPKDAAAKPMLAHIWRVKFTVDVLPLVPVTAAITWGWRA